MGILDRVVGTVTEALSGGAQSSLGKAALDLLGSQQVGGVQGLTALFQQKGLGKIVASWTSTGPNQAISADQIQQALGSDTITALAQKAGISPDQARQSLAQLLPSLVDKLTPNGQIPQGQDIAQAGLTALKSILG